MGEKEVIVCSAWMISAVAAACVCAEVAWAQSADLTPSISKALVVEVQSTFSTGDGEPGSLEVASGTIIGYRSDSLFIVTTNHQFEDTDWTQVRVQVRLTANGALHPAAIKIRYIRPDLAVIAVSGYMTEGLSKLPGVVPRATRELISHQKTFVLGCPDGRCWGEPEEAVLTGSKEEFLLFRIHYLKPGTSGGLLVDTHGAPLGLVVKEYEGEGHAIAWSVVENIIRRHGFPMNLPTSQGFRAREWGFRLLGASWPAGGVNTDGRRLQRAWRAETALRITPRLEAAFGATRLSFAASPFATREADYDEAYVHVFPHVGLRYNFPLRRWKLGRRMPDVVSVGTDLLWPLDRDTYVVGMAVSDSVDLERGEYVRVRSVIQSRTGLAIGYRASYRIAVSERLGVLVAPSLYITSFEYLYSSPARGFLEIGADLRLWR